MHKILCFVDLVQNLFSNLAVLHLNAESSFLFLFIAVWVNLDMSSYVSLCYLRDNVFRKYPFFKKNSFF